MKKTQAIIITFVILVLTLTVSGQDETPIKIDTNLVNVNVAVFDKKGEFVEGLTKDNFLVFDNSIKQKIKYFSAEDAPISFGIVYDLHPTTSERTKAVLESLREFEKRLNKQDDFFALVFNQRGTLLVDFVPTIDQLNKNLIGKYRQPNSLYDAIYMATEKIYKQRNLKRILYVITDSADHNSEHKFSDIEEKLKNADTKIYTILWDEAKKWEYSEVTGNGEPRSRISSDATSLSRAALEELAIRTGGIVRSPTVQNAGELYRIYEQIRLDVRRQYTIGFYPEKLDDKWHEIKVLLNSVRNSKKFSMNYRTGYKSPKPN